MNPKTIVCVGILGVFLWISLGLFSIIPWQVAGVMTAVSIGIPTLLLHYERGKSNVSISQVNPKERLEEKETYNSVQEAKIKEQKMITGSPLLPDTTDIIKLRIGDSFLDQLYEEARSKAVNIYNDAMLSSFSIQANPFGEIVSVYIYFPLS